MDLLLIPGGLLLAVLALGLLLRILNPLPPLAGRTLTHALDGADTRLGQALAADIAGNPGLSGVMPLPDARESFAARMWLIQAAERSLDLQYYIWRGDTSGRMLMNELVAAASRGVRVRLLLDDNGTSGLDAELVALDAHPNIEVRLFNPFTIRRPKLIGYLMDFLRMNRRMHNKSLTADSQITIIGGRNVGDEYFGAHSEALFADLDVLAAGAVLLKLAADFDRYWSSLSAYPVSSILPPFDGQPVAFAPSDPAEIARTRAYEEAVRDSVVARQLARGRPDFDWKPVRLLSDNPAKALGKARESELLIAKLLTIVGNPQKSLTLVSAYFVPAREGAAVLTGLAKSGVRVSVLTNALNATDVAIVHAGYAKHRRALLKAGVRLWEKKGLGKAKLKLSPVGSGRMMSRPVFRSSGSSLHAKTFAIDGAHLFVGSFNFDPRSALLNTELGFLIGGPKLACELDTIFESGLGEEAYEVKMSENGRRLEWHEVTPQGVIVHRKEPNSGPLQRAVLKGLSLLPIDWLL